MGLASTDMSLKLFNLVGVSNCLVDQHLEVEAINQGVAL